MHINVCWKEGKNEEWKEKENQKIKKKINLPPPFCSYLYGLNTCTV